MVRLMQHLEPVDAFEAAFGTRVRERREGQGLSQRALAEALADRGLHLDSSAITRIEKGQRAVRLGEAPVIADALDIQLADLIEGPIPPAQRVALRRMNADRFIVLARWRAIQALEELAGAEEIVSESPEALHEAIQQERRRPKGAPSAPAAESYLAAVRDHVRARLEPHADDRWPRLASPTAARRQALQAIADVLLLDLVVEPEQAEETSSDGKHQAEA